MTDVDVRFRVVMPEAWTVLPLHAGDRKARLRRLVRDRMGRSDELAAERYELAQLLERWAREIEQVGAFFAATYEELFDGQPVAATLVATRTPRPPDIDADAERLAAHHAGPDVGAGAGRMAVQHDGTDIDADVDADRKAAQHDGPDVDPDAGRVAGLFDEPGVGGDAGRMAALCDGPGVDGDAGPMAAHDVGSDVDADAGRMGALYDGAGEVSVVEIPLGWAVRVRERGGSGLEGSDGTELTTESLQFFVPLTGTPDMIVLTFSTPTLQLADRFVELFDAIARTARLDVDLTDNDC